jgi:hypothetical protein
MSLLGERRSLATQVLAAISLAVLTTFAAHHTRLLHFGLYEDDWLFIAPHLDPAGPRLWDVFVHQLRAWPQGRPLSHTFPPLVGALGSALGGLPGAYVIGAAWVALNGTLMWLVARRLVSPQAAPVAAVVYLLFPADGGRVLLTSVAVIQGSLTFLLGGTLLWLRGGAARWASYPVAGLSLLTYETGFLPFLALPLLVPAEKGRWLRRGLAHLGACAVVVGAAAAKRFAAGDSRALTAAAAPGETLRRMLTSLYLGPATSMRLMHTSVREGLRAADPLSIACALAVAAGLVVAVLAAGRRPAPDGADDPGAPRLGWSRLAAAALVVWSLAYLLTIINYPPTWTVGRLTSVHAAAAFGAALVVAALFEALHRRGGTWAFAALAAVGLWLGGVVTYHHWLQRGFVSAWELQRSFWSQVMTLGPDVAPGWSVLANGTPRTPTPGSAFANSWADCHVLPQVFASPWARGPKFAHVGYYDPVVVVAGHDGQRWTSSCQTDPVPIDPARLVLLEDDLGTLRRVSELRMKDGTILRATAPIPSPRKSWPDTSAAHLLSRARVTAR